MNNPYLYRPQPSSLRAADALFQTILSHPDWLPLFSQGKMLGVLVYSREPFKYICAYSGVINGLNDPEHFFVPPIYDLQNPDDFYLQKDAEISAINQSIASLTLKLEAIKEFQVSSEFQVTREFQVSSEPETLKPETLHPETLSQQIAEQKALRKQLSTALQMEIFEHFDFLNPRGQYKNIVQIFSDARRGLPPGGAGECAAPRLLQYALQHKLPILELAECWFGASPRATLRVHGQFYPSCIEKCSPILNYMTQGIEREDAPEAEAPLPLPDLDIIYEDEYLLIVNKPAGALSVAGKVAGESIEERLHTLYPHVKGPMLVHRLDQSTSGLLLAAKDARTHKALQQSFESRQIHKEYLALLDGHLASQCGVINLPICPNPDDRPRQIVDFQFGKPAVTQYEVIAYQTLPTEDVSDSPKSADILPAKKQEFTLIRFSPHTGRTHQLRLHAASHLGLGHPIVGDRIYGGSPHPRLMLHACRLSFNHPVTGQPMHFSQDPTWRPAGSKRPHP